MYNFLELTLNRYACVRVSSQEQADDGPRLSVWRRRPAAAGRRPGERKTGGGQTGHRPLGDTVSLYSY